MKPSTDPHIREFAVKHRLTGLSVPSLQAIMDNKNGYSIDRGSKFLRFQRRIDSEMLQHRIITGNRYTNWFKLGLQDREQIKAFIVQFSVFSNQFLIAQIHKMVNADSLETMRASKEILANEIGVVFNAGNKAATYQDEKAVDPELVSTEGTVDGGTFRFRAAHFEWLLQIAEKLGLSFNDLGKRCHGIQTTLFFCDELVRLYGSTDYETSQASSYAVENWAAAGFWAELIEGFTRYNQRTGSDLPLAFFTWHDKIESQHARHTQEELEEIYFQRGIDEDAFIYNGNDMLNGVAAFWDGLNEQRKHAALAA